MAIKIVAELQRDIADDLSRLAAVSPMILAGTLRWVSLQAKNRVKDSIQKEFFFPGRNEFRPPGRSEKSHMGRDVRFDSVPKRVRIPNRYKLLGPKLGSVYEYNGADIFPKRRLDDTDSDSPKLLKWRNEIGDWMSSNFVHIDPQPFFYPTIRKFLASGELSRTVDEGINYQMKANRIGTPENNR